MASQKEMDATAKTILVVDDDRLVRTSVRHILEESGYDVVEAQSATEAMRVCATEPVRLLLTDIIMPGTQRTRASEPVANQQRKPQSCLYVCTAKQYFERKRSDRTFRTDLGKTFQQGGPN